METSITLTVDEAQRFEPEWIELAAHIPSDVAATVVVAVKSARDGSTRVASGRTLTQALDNLAGKLRSG